MARMYMKLSNTTRRDHEEKRGNVIKWVIHKIRADVVVMVILDMVR